MRHPHAEFPLRVLFHLSRFGPTQDSADSRPLRLFISPHMLLLGPIHYRLLILCRMLIERGPASPVSLHHPAFLQALQLSGASSDVSPFTHSSSLSPPWQMKLLLSKDKLRLAWVLPTCVRRGECRPRPPLYGLHRIVHNCSKQQGKSIVKKQVGSVHTVSFNTS